jgi:phosphate transport system substrate-binding protein
MTKHLVPVSTFVAAVLLAACNQAAQVQERTHILAAGSSTVYPFTSAVAERFHAANGQFAAPVIQATGTGPGFSAFCAGVGGTHPDVVNASRRIRPAEMAECRAHGVANITELQIGMDGIVLVQSPAAPPIRLTRRQLYEALAANPYGQPNTKRKWREIDSSLPDIPILVYGPPAGDGTRDSFVEMVMIPGCESNAEMRRLRETDDARFNQVCTTLRSDGAYAASGEDDQRTATSLIVNPGAIGIFGYSYLEHEGERLRGIALEGVMPSGETITSGRYAGARPLFVYVKADQAERVPGLRQFVAEYARAIGPGTYLAQRGLIPAAAPVRARTAQAAAGLTPLNPANLR